MWMNETFLLNLKSETIVQLNVKIESSYSFKGGGLMVADLLVSIPEEYKSKDQIEAQKLQAEKIKLAQLEKQPKIEK